MITNLIENIISDMISKLIGVSIIPYLWIFVVGMIVAEYRSYIIPILKNYFFIFVIAVVICRIINLDYYIHSYPFILSLVTFMAIIGLVYRFPAVNIKTDISYGIFIYHMILVNMAIEFGWTNSIWGICFVIICTSVAALLSTKLIGQKVAVKRIKMCAIKKNDCL